MNKRYNIKYSFLLISLLLMSACSTPSTSNFDDDESTDNLNIAFNTLLQGQFSNISLPNQLVIKTSKDWRRLLKIHGDIKNLKKQKVDFYDKIIIAIFAGQQPSGGYAVNVTNIKRIDNNLHVTVSFHEPGNNESVSLALTQPFILLETDKVEGRIIFLAPPSKK